MIISLQQLHDLGAPDDLMDVFAARFGESVEVTEALCAEHADAFDFNWLADNLLSPSARDDFYHAKELAWAAFKRVQARVLEECECMVAQAPDKESKARYKYKRIKRQVWDEYERITARAFARAYIAQSKEAR